MRLRVTLLALLAAVPAAGGVLTVIGTEPPARALGVAVTTAIEVTFDRPVDPTTVTAASFWAFGRTGGLAAGPLAISPDGLTVTLDPVADLASGDLVTVVLSHDLEALDGSALRAAGWSFQFRAAAAPAELEFVEADRLTTRTVPEEPSRAYGGLAGDLDGDGDLDWMLSSFGGDWTLFANDGTGAFTFVREFAATQAASCSVLFDMDRDGDLDLALIDELEDEVILVHNVGGIFADGFESGDTAAWSQTVP